MLHRTLRLGISNVLGMMLPRSGSMPEAAVPAPGSPEERQDLDMAAQLEAANARIRLLQEQDDERVQRRAEELVAGIFPQTEVPEHQPQRYGPQPTGEGGEPPTFEERINAQLAELQGAVRQNAVTLGVRDLNDKIVSAKQKFPDADVTKVMMQIANAPDDAGVNVERLMQLSHDVENRRFEDRYTARRAAESNQTRENAPPPVPTKAGGAPVVGDPITQKTAATRLVQFIRERMPSFERK